MQHHALLYTSSDLSLAVLPEAVRSESIDIVHVIAPTFTVEDARAVTAAAAVRPLVASQRTLVIAARTMTREAQNALLKILEEPPESICFHIITPSLQSLLPTLRSRLFLVTTTISLQKSEVWSEFCKSSYKDRLSQIADAASKKNIEWIDAVAAGALSDSQIPKETALLLDEHLRRSGASKKMLLEAVALAI